MTTTPHSQFYDPFNLPNDPKPPDPEVIRKYQEWIEQRRLGLSHYRAQRAIARTTNQHNTYVWNAGELRRYSLYLSDYAITTLKEMATKYHYGHDDSRARHAYLSTFLRALANPTITWEDNRPLDLKDIDPVRISLGLLPIWLTQDERLPRAVRTYFFTEDIYNDFYQLALYHGIVSLFNKPTRINKGTTVSALFEIIAHNRLVPTNMPFNPDELSYNRPYQKPPKNYTTYI